MRMVIKTVGQDGMSAMCVRRWSFSIKMRCAPVIGILV